MSMTEKQGGSDVRANTTEATPVVPGKEASGGGWWGFFREQNWNFWRSMKHHMFLKQVAIVCDLLSGSLCTKII